MRDAGSSCSGSSTGKPQTSCGCGVQSGLGPGSRRADRPSLTRRRAQTRTCSARRLFAWASLARRGFRTSSRAATSSSCARPTARHRGAAPGRASLPESAASSTAAKTGSRLAWARAGPTGSGRRAGGRTRFALRLSEQHRRRRSRRSRRRCTGLPRERRGSPQRCSRRRRRRCRRRRRSLRRACATPLQRAPP